MVPVELIGLRFGQMAYVTNNIDRALEELGAGLGLTEWFRTDGAEFEVRPGEIAVCNVALAESADIQIEIIQPVAGATQVYESVLVGDDYQIRHHHVAYWPDSLAEFDTAKAEMHARGFAFAVESTGRYGSYFYADTRNVLGHYVECMCFAPGVYAELRQLIPAGQSS